jgi:hypothetical protein
MSGTAPQQSRTPRVSRHKHSKSAVPASDSETAQVARAQQPKQNRHNNVRNGAHPAWQNDPSRPIEGYFNDKGEFIMIPTENAVNTGTTGYGSPSEANLSVAKRPAKKQARNKHNPPRQNGNQSPQPALPQYEQQQMAPPPNQTFSPPAMTPAKTSAAYAGPTWNASPAASALPMPKFLSKSMPPETSQPTLQARLDQESDQSDKAESPPLSDAVPAIPTPPRNEDSPLDFLFKKDKEQKAKRQSAGPGAIGSTPTRPAVGSFNSEPQQPADWASIYGTGARDHHRHASNGSNKEQFMMELDGRNASPQAHKASPRPALNERMSSAPSAVPQNIPSPYHNALRNGQPMYASPMHGNSMPSLVPSPGQHHPGPRLPDASASPFYRGPQQLPRSADSTPMPRQGAAYHQNLHYGNRNLGPLFQAAKQDPDRRASNLRQEIHTSPKVAELPDNANHFTQGGSNRMNYQHQTANPEHAVRAYLQSQKPPATTLPSIDLPRQQFSNSLPPVGSSELDAQSRPQSHNGPYPAPSLASSGLNAHQGAQSTTFNAKSVEDDLKRMLKMSLAGNSFDSPGVH